MDSTFDYIWLSGNPIFSLVYHHQKLGNVLTDVTGYRPDPRDKLIALKKHQAQLFFDQEIDYKGEKITILRKIKLADGQVLTYIR